MINFCNTNFETVSEADKFKKNSYDFVLTRKYKCLTIAGGGEGEERNRENRLKGYKITKFSCAIERFLYLRKNKKIKQPAPLYSKFVFLYLLYKSFFYSKNITLFYLLYYFFFFFCIFSIRHTPCCHFRLEAISSKTEHASRGDDSNPTGSPY